MLCCFPLRSSSWLEKVLEERSSQEAEPEASEAKSKDCDDGGSKARGSNLLHFCFVLLTETFFYLFFFSFKRKFYCLAFYRDSQVVFFKAIVSSLTFKKVFNLQARSTWEFEGRDDVSNRCPNSSPAVVKTSPNMWLMVNDTEVLKSCSKSVLTRV